MQLVGQTRLECIETRFRVVTDPRHPQSHVTAAPPIPPGFRRRMLRIEEGPPGVFTVTATDIEVPPGV